MHEFKPTCCVVYVQLRFVSTKISRIVLFLRLRDGCTGLIADVHSINDGNMVTFLLVHELDYERTTLLLYNGTSSCKVVWKTNDRYLINVCLIF